MKTLVKLAICIGAGLLAACNSADQKLSRSSHKIYLTEQDYLDDLGQQAAQERREAQPPVESEYVFNTVPQTDKGVYFFDDRQRPKVPGQPSDADYKREKRLWEKPKRYSPDEYYGMQEGGDTSESSGETYTSDY